MCVTYTISSLITSSVLRRHRLQAGGLATTLEKPTWACFWKNGCQFVYLTETSRFQGVGSRECRCCKISPRLMLGWWDLVPVTRVMEQFLSQILGLLTARTFGKLSSELGGSKLTERRAGCVHEREPIILTYSSRSPSGFLRLRGLSTVL